MTAGRLPFEKGSLPEPYQENFMILWKTLFVE
jgi:hypothetical protein